MFSIVEISPSPQDAVAVARLAELRRPADELNALAERVADVVEATNRLERERQRRRGLRPDATPQQLDDDVLGERVRAYRAGLAEAQQDPGVPHWWLEYLQEQYHAYDAEARARLARWQLIHAPDAPAACRHRRRQADLDRIKRAVRLDQLAAGYTRLRQAGRRLVGACPLHADRRPSFVVYLDQGRWYCFGCSQGGDAISLVMAKERLDFIEALEWLGRWAGVAEVTT